MGNLSGILSQENKRQKTGEGIYLLYFAIMAGARAFGLYEGMTLYNLALIIGMFLFVCKMAITKHTISEYAIAGILLALAGVVYLNSGEKGLLVCFTMMLGMKGVSAFKVVRAGAIVCGMIIMAKIFLGVFGFTSEIYYPQERDGVGLMFRHALGYAHPNTLHMNVLMLSMMFMFLITTYLSSGVAQKKKEYGVYVIITSFFVLGFNIYIFQYSGSRTGLLTCFLYLAVNLWLFARKKIGLFEKSMLYMSFPAVSFISIVLPLILKGSIFDFINGTIFSNRFLLARYFWENNNLSLFGQRLNSPFEAWQSYGIDMAQVYLLLQLGLIAFGTIAFITIAFIYWSIKKDRRAELSVLMGILFLGMWEPLLYNLGFKNFVYVFMGAALYEWMAMRRGEEYGFADACVTCELKCKLVNVKFLLTSISVGIVTGVVISMLYMAATSAPTALYGDRERGESGNSFGMEALYISEAEMESIEDSGDIVIGYVDETVPMYKYSSEIATMEYSKKVMSVGVWSGITIMLVVSAITFLLSHKKV